MDPRLEEEQRNRKSYRLILIGAIVLVAALSIWLAFPPKPIDLRFFSTLNPKRLKAPYDWEEEGTTLEFTQSTPELERLFESHVEGIPDEDRTVTGASVNYFFRKGHVSITISPNGKRGSDILIVDPGKRVRLP